METTTPQNPTAPVSAKQSAIVKWAFIIGITLLSNLFVAYLVQALYPAPEYEVFCPAELSARMVETESQCREMRGQWYGYNDGISPKTGSCDLTVECRGKYEDATALHDRNVFIVFVAFGALLLLASVYLGLAEVIALGLSFGGVLALIIGSTWHWSTMQEWLRVIVLGVALLAVIVTAAKKFKV